MNLAQLKKNLFQRVQLRPIVCQRAQDERELKGEDDDWIIQEVSDNGIRISNIRTQHCVILGQDHIHHYTSNPERSQHGIKHGFLTLNVQIFLRGAEVAIEPNPSPGRPVTLEGNVEAHLREITRKLNLLTSPNDPKKSVRAIKFLSETGYGNRRYRDFLLWAFPEFEDGLLAALKSRSFDGLCEGNGIPIQIVPVGGEQSLFDDFYRKAPEVNSIWNGISYFQRNDKGNQTFGAYLKNHSLVVNRAALEDFRQLHSLFRDYVNSAVSEEQLHKEITPEGIVPPDY
jgi:hypothetical protein